MIVLSAEYAERITDTDVFQVILGELRFINNMLCYIRRPGANYILPDKITYDLKNIKIDGPFTRIARTDISEGHSEFVFDRSTKLTFFKYDDSALIISFIKDYSGTVRNGSSTGFVQSSIYAFSALVLLRCKSVISQFPSVCVFKDISNTPEFYYMSKDLYGVDHVRDLLKQFMDYGLPFPDYILNKAIDSGDLEYAAALVHEKDALQMSGKEEVLRL